MSVLSARHPVLSTFPTLLLPAPTLAAIPAAASDAPTGYQRSGVIRMIDDTTGEEAGRHPVVRDLRP
jgi:hypothetical protein